MEEGAGGLVVVVVVAVAVDDDEEEGWEVDTDTERDEAATEGAPAAEGLEAGGFGFEAEATESRDEKMLAGLEEAPDGLEGPALVEGEDAVAVALVTEGAEGWARPMDAGVSRIGAAEDGIFLARHV